MATCWGGDREPRRGVRDGGRRRNPRFTNTRFDGALPRSPTHLLLRRRREAAHAKGAQGGRRAPRDDDAKHDFFVLGKKESERVLSADRQNQTALALLLCTTRWLPSRACV